MAQFAFVLSTVLTGALLVGAAAALSRRGWHRPAPSSERGADAFLDGRARWALWLGVAVVALGGLVAVGDGLGAASAGALLGGVFGAALLAYFAWGVYHSARHRGLPGAHAVGLSAWVVGLVFVGAVAVRLVLA